MFCPPDLGKPNLDLIPPHDLTAESALLGSILLENSMVDDVAAVIEPRHFYSSTNAAIYNAITRLRSGGVAADAVTLADDLHRRGNLTEVGGPAYIAELCECVPHALHAPHYARIIRSHWARREVIYTATEALKSAYLAGADAGEIVAQTEARFREIECSRAVERFPALTCAELDDLNCDDAYLIDDILTAGQPGLIGGPKKTLKTNASIDLVLSLATGAKFLNQFYVRTPCKSALISGESGAATIQETARRVAKSKGWSLREMTDAYFTFNLPNLSDDADLLHLARYVQKHELRVLVLDPAYLCLDVGEGAGNLFIVGKQLKPLSLLAADHGLTLLLNVHARKRSNTPYEPMELEDVAWSGFQEWARQWLLINRREPYLADNPGSHRLWFGTGGSAGHSGLWGLDIEEGKRHAPDESGHRIPRTWDIKTTTAAKIRAETADVVSAAKEDRKKRELTAKYQANRKKVLDALSYYKGGETLSMIATRAKVANKIARIVMEDLTDDGLIEDVEITKNRRTETGYKLATIQEDEAGRIGRTEDCPGGTVRPARGGGTTPP